MLSLLPHFLSAVSGVIMLAYELKLCINLPQSLVHELFLFFFLYILIVTYNNMHLVCYGDCNWEKTQGSKFV